MKKLLIVSMMILGMCGAANALTIINGGFETGDFSGWMGDINSSKDVVTFHSGFGPTQGSYFARLESNYGTILSQNISWEAGDTLSFDWNFNTYDWLPWNDRSIFQINDYEGGIIDFGRVIVILADVAAVRPYNEPGHYDLPGCGDPYLNGCYDWNQPIATGWNTYSHTFSQAGSGFITFGVFNWGDESIPSYLYVDNVGAPVPEPSTFLLLGAGLVGLGFVFRRRKEE